MSLPVTRTNPIAERDTMAMAEISWEWVCWLKDWRARYESGSLSPSETDERKIERHFSEFRQERGFLCVANSMADMPSDARVDFVYTPTVTAAAILNLARINNESRVCRRFLRETIEAACGRKLMGHGYDAIKYMAFQIELLAYGLLFSRERPLGTNRSVFMNTVLNCYRKMSEELLDPPTADQWSGVEPSWSEHCLRLLNCSDNNWVLLTSSPLVPEFERTHKILTPMTTFQIGDLFDE